MRRDDMDINTPQFAQVLSAWAPRCFVAAHLEDTSRLEEAMRREGFLVDVVRIEYTASQRTMSPTRKCLLTHREIWRRAAAFALPWMAVEADFVPCQGLGRIPVPLRAPPAQKRMMYLYACGPTLYRVMDRKWGEGDAAASVAWAADPEVATLLLDMTQERLSDANLEIYTPWDSTISATLRRKMGVRTLIPVRNLGEHGGLPNPEHRLAGLKSTHRADSLAAPLHFLPLYAANRRSRFLAVRFMYWLYGCGRLIFGRLAMWRELCRFQNRLLTFCIRRLLPWPQRGEAVPSQMAS